MSNAFSEASARLLKNGYSTIPTRGKRPVLRAWQDYCGAQMVSNEVRRFARSPVSYGIGVALGFNRLIAIDIDTEDTGIFAAIRSVLPASPVAKRGCKGRTDFYRDITGTVRARKFAGPIGMMVEILARGNQTVIPPTPHPDTGLPYLYLGEQTLENTRPEELPVIAPDIADQLASVLAPWSNKSPHPAPARRPASPCKLSDANRARQRRYAKTIITRDLMALGAMARDTGRNQATFRLACRVGRWVHAGIISQDRFVANVLDACSRNGLIREDGRRSVLATIFSGLAKSAGDTLPDLGGARHG